MSMISRGLKNAGYLAAGNLLVQVISFIGFIYIARILGPDDYGTYLTVGAFVGIFDLLLLEGLNKTVLREGSKDISSMHVSLERTIGIRNILTIIAIVVCIISSFFTPYEFQTKLYIIIFSFQLTYTGLRGFLATIYQASERMQYISIFGILNRILFVSLSITFLYLGYGLLALFLIALFSNLLTIIINFRFSRRFVKFDFFSKIQFDKRLLKPSVTFSLLTFLGFFISRVDLLMISLLGTSKDVGIYGVAYRIAQQGQMLRNVTATAFFPIFVKIFHKDKMRGSLLIKYSLYFIVGIFILALLATFFVDDIVIFLFGLEYKYSGEILRILIFYLTFFWATLPFTTAIQATHNEKYLLISDSVMAGLNIPLNYIFFLKYGAIGIAYSTLVVYAVGSILMSTITYRILKKQGHLV